MPRLYVYSRVSTLRQMTGHGLTGQDEARERWLADNQEKYDLELVEDYRDLGISGRGKNVTEGKMGLILDGIKSGKIPTGSWLAVDSLDRISRDELIEAHYLVSGIVRAGIIIVTIADGMIFDRSEKEKPIDLAGDASAVIERVGSEVVSWPSELGGEAGRGGNWQANDRDDAGLD